MKDPKKKLKILSTSPESFRDRMDAGRLLALELKEYKGKNAVVLGIPRGGIVVALEVARFLDAELDIVLSHKLGAPGNPEFAIGSVSEDGKVFLDEDSLLSLMVSNDYIEKEKERRLAEIKERVKKYREIRPKARLKDRIVIVTDDGIATGATMKAALWSARQEGPSELVAAIPVGPPETLNDIASGCDELICLRAPQFFSAVGQFYREFRQVEDEEVMDILKNSINPKEKR